MTSRYHCSKISGSQQLTTTENTIINHNAHCVTRLQHLHKHCFHFPMRVKIAQRETENNAYVKFGVTNKEHYGMLWYSL